MDRSQFCRISELNHYVKDLLNNNIGQIWLQGEISNYRPNNKGTWYFSLLDPDPKAQIAAFMFYGDQRYAKCLPKNGLRVIALANITLYEPNGTYQAQILEMEPIGAGLLEAQLEELKKKLQAKGYFDPYHKKPLPKFCRKIGIVTSPTGAAIKDILNVLARRDPNIEVIIYPTLVQGETAGKQIAQMIQLANQRNEVEILIVGRGGGSKEDLWCFNEEIVAEAIFQSCIPIVSAVGHEIDVSIADFVADVRAATPSAAAEMISHSQDELAQWLKNHYQRLILGIDSQLTHKERDLIFFKNRLYQAHPKHQLAKQQLTLMQQKQRLHHTFQHFLSYQQVRLQSFTTRLRQHHPQQKLTQQQQKLTIQEKRLHQAFLQALNQKQQCFQQLHYAFNQNPLTLQLQQKHQRFSQLAQRLSFLIQQIQQQKQHHYTTLCEKLHQLSPLTILSRGYSITLDKNGKTLTNAQQIHKGQCLVTKLEKGSVVSKVLEVKE